ncbi:MAG: geranylgeranylglycerol-phosphate geranylgeranyltransferase [Bacteroidales bacterium]|jgi:4-hydroxybenzoate polyprenyltransferase|nr:geranylgeranylglycerol-phosphate geranylgeranyltransferase [Bacteroidales bacterium]
MKEFLILIRWQNLLIVILTMVMMRYFVIEPLLSGIDVTLISSPGEAVPMALQLPWYDFIILVAATVFITAGGYVINDYFDIKTDLLNRGKVIVGTRIPRRQAMMWHNIFNILGVAAGFYISWKAGYIWMGILFLLVSGLLYFYSVSYKRQFIIGNILVAILTAIVPLLVILYEWPALYRFYTVNTAESPVLGFLFYWVGSFALFAFLTTLSREIIKDIEDFEGDMAYGRNTIPVVIGIPASRVVAVSLIIVTLSMLYLVWHFFINDKITLIYLSSVIVLPLLFVIYLVAIGRNKKQLHAASNIMKLIMLAGILYSAVVKAIITWNLL